MIKFYVYNASGKILRTGKCQIETLSYQAFSVGEIAVEGEADLNTQYIVAGVLTDRPILHEAGWNTLSISANNVDTATYGGSMPAGTVATVITPTGVDNIMSDVSDGILDITTSAPGDYTVLLQKFPYQDHKDVLTVTPVGTSGLDKYGYTQAGSIEQVSNLSQLFESPGFTQTGSDIGLGESQTLDANSYTLEGRAYPESNLNLLMELGEYTQASSTISSGLVQILFSGDYAQAGNSILQSAPQALNTHNFAQLSGVIAQGLSQTLEVNSYAQTGSVLAQSISQIVDSHSYTQASSGILMNVWQSLDEGGYTQAGSIQQDTNLNQAMGYFNYAQTGSAITQNNSQTLDIGAFYQTPSTID